MRSIAVICVALAVSACSTSTTGLTQRCTNPQSGVSVSYPEGWFTNDDVMPPCSVFDPRPVELPRDSEIPFDISVTLSVQEHPFESDVRSTQWERILSRQETTIGGRRALRIEAEATGEGLADRGMRSLRYVIDLGNGRTLIASTHDAGGDYEGKKEIVAQMVQTISVP